MINFSNVIKIFRKEIKLYLRDKSVIFTNLFIPFIVGPFYLMFMVEVANQMVKKENKALQDNTVFKVSYQGSITDQLLSELQSNPKLEIVTNNSHKIEESKIIDYRQKFKLYVETLQGEYSLSKNINKAITQKKNPKLQVYKIDVEKVKASIEKHFDFKSVDLHIAFFPSAPGHIATYFFYSSESQKSNAAYRFVKQEIEKHRQDQYQSTLETNQQLKQMLPPDYSFWDVDLLDPESKFFLITGLMSTAFICMILLTGIYMPTIRSTIGEKDAQTYKILMMTPIAPSEIFLGKLLSITMQGIVLLIPYTIEGLILFALGAKSGSFSMLSNLSFANYIQAMGLVLSIIMICSSICFFACSFSKSSNQAQSFLSLFMFVILTPLILILINETELNYYNALIPFYNFPLVIASMLKGSLPMGSYLAALSINIITALIITLLSVNAFIVQWKGRDDSFSFSDLLSRKSQSGGLLTPAHAFFGFSIILVGHLFSKSLSALEFKFLYYFSFPSVFMLGTCFVVIAYTKIDPFKAIKWKGKNSSTFLYLTYGTFLATALGVIFTLVVPTNLWVHNYLNLFDTNTLTGTLASLLVFALLPAVTEEILFRGIMYQGLRSQYSQLTANVVSTIMATVILLPVYKSFYIPLTYLLLNSIYERKDLFHSLLANLIIRSSITLFAINYVDWSEQLQGNYLILSIASFCLLSPTVMLFLRSKTKSACPVIEIQNNDAA